MMQEKEVNIFNYINQPCPVCLQDYDTEAKAPMRVCQNEHFCCNKCLEKYRKKGEPFSCSECRSKIDEENVTKPRVFFKVVQQTKGEKMMVEKDQIKCISRQRRSGNLQQGQLQQKENNESVKQGTLKQAVRQRERLVENQLHNLQNTLLNQAIAQFRGKQIQRCIATCKSILQNNPQELRQFIGLGSKEEQKGFYEGKTVEWFNNKFKYKKISCYDLLALCFLIEGKFEEQKKWYEKMNYIHPQNCSILYGLAVTFHNNGNLDKAEEIYHELIRIQPKFSKSYQMLGFICEYKGNDQQMASYVQKLLKCNSGNIYACLLLAIYYCKKRLYDKCQKIVIDIQQQCPQYVRAQCLQGLNLINQNKYEMAQQKFDKCIAVNNHFKLPILCKAKCLVELGKFKEAIQALQLYESLHDKNNDKCLYQIGAVYGLMKDVEKAEEYLLRSLQLNPSRFSVYNMLGSLYKSNNEYEKAAQAYENFVKSSPNQYKALKTIIECYLKLKKATKIIEWGQKLKKLNPKIPIDYLSFANEFFRNKDYVQSLQILYECLKRDFPKAQIYEKILKIYQIQNNYEKQIEQSRKWLLSDINNPKIWKRISDIYLNASKDIVSKRWVARPNISL